ncbi:hypothetical protein B0T14DRAFT_517111 [Immersiella caudata]|uniref:Uncharacterized protein n=1 Tax=Immersiella caudata TaxID=314043 RepID=A0AA39WYF4_9PEZI|nr:hypothetical protein B0T14DRAFT_517111 [Immersiella caudata]
MHPAARNLPVGCLKKCGRYFWAPGFCMTPFSTSPLPTTHYHDQTATTTHSNTTTTIDRQKNKTNTKMTKTYFLTPGWDIPSTTPLLGTIIANPSQPDLALFTPSPSSLTTTTSSPVSFTSPPIPSPSDPPQSLFHTFLTTYGLGPEPAITFDHKHGIRSYSLRDQRSITLKHDVELLKNATGDVKVSTLFKNNVGVYLITGIKTVTGAAVTVASSKGREWDVNLGISTGGEGVIFAVEVVEVRVEGEEVIVKELGVGEGALQTRLDGEFGEGMFRVVKGVDEGVEGGEGVQIVTASGTYVDLLTASTAKVGGEHGIWY